MPSSIPLFVLALGAFCIGTAEFMVLGLLPSMAQDLAISLPQAGALITCYALSVAVSAPAAALMTQALSRRVSLIGLMGLFVAGNLVCATTHSFFILLVARAISALCHAPFFGLSAIEVTHLVGEKNKASALSFLFFGFTLSNIIGVPIATLLGAKTHWHIPFYVVVLLGTATLFLLYATLPRCPTKEGGDDAISAPSLKRECASLLEGRIWLALGTTIVSSVSLYSLFTFIVPILQGDGMSISHISWMLFLVGVGFTVGSLLGGRLAGKSISLSLIGIYSTIVLVDVALFWLLRTPLLAGGVLFLWGVAAFCTVPVLQANIMHVGRHAPRFLSIINIGAFNIGNALGAWLSSVLIYYGLPFDRMPLAASCAATVALGLSIWAAICFRSKPPTPSSHVASPIPSSGPSVSKPVGIGKDLWGDELG